MVSVVLSVAPTWLVKKSAAVLSPVIAAACNASVKSGLLGWVTAFGQVNCLISLHSQPPRPTQPFILSW